MKRIVVAAAAVLLSVNIVWGDDASPTTNPAEKPVATLDVRLDQPAKPISPDLFGIFFEDLNYAADGGLYAEMVANRSFDYSAMEQPDWNALTGWQLVNRGNAKGSISIEDVSPLAANNPTYLVLNSNGGNGSDAGAAVVNNGFDGIAIKAGETYNFSVFARQRPKDSASLVVRLEGSDGTLYASAALPKLTTEWAKYTATLTPSHDDANARLVILNAAKSTVFLDMVSLFPAKTFHDRPNGLRADLAQTIADLHPKFVRFPGGCLTHGDGINNIYRWKDTIGPIEQRKGQRNIWRYHQSVGLGYFEYFQFCEDIGAAPLPVVAAGVSCQNSDRNGGTGQQCIPMQDMPAYAQDILDLVEYANGPATSSWGAKRAEAGHPEPFHLKYLGIGNEDAMTSGFHERFKMLYEAVHAKYPELKIVGTAGPAPDGFDFDAGWKTANELSVPIIDEHYYQPPGWFLSHLDRYDGYDRSHSQVYVGEYASRGNTMGNALAEAAYMTSLERNGDIVHMASYAPLLCKTSHVQWYPDMIYFDNSGVFPSVNYYVQQLFCTNSGVAYVPSKLSVSGTNNDEAPSATVSTVRDPAGDVIIKFVNLSASPMMTTIHLAGAGKIEPEAKCLVLSADDAFSNPGDPRRKSSSEKTAARPTASNLKVGEAFEYAAPPHSLSVMSIKTGA